MRISSHEHNKRIYLEFQSDSVENDSYHESHVWINSDEAKLIVKLLQRSINKISKKT